MKSWSKPAHALFAIAWGGNEFTPLIVMYKTEHHLSAVTVDTLLFAYVLGLVPALLIGGPLSDRLGRATLLKPAPWIAILGSATLALAHGNVAALFAGRIFSGIALGLAMAVGSSWVKELSSPPFNDVPAAEGAKRSAMALTAGFGLGAGIAGVLAQWAPAPDELAYLVNILVTLSAAIRLRGTPETVDLGSRAITSLREDLRIPLFAHSRFWGVVLPVAPWVFGSAASAYAVLPALMTSHVSSAPIAFSAFMCLIGLTCGFFVQSLGRRIDQPGSTRAVQVSLGVLALGMMLAALTASKLTIITAIIASLTLGAGYGLALVSGLLEIQRIAGPRDLAGLTAVFYSVTYLGFAAPAVMAALATSFHLHYTSMFLFGACMALVCMAVVRSYTHLAQSRSAGS